MGCLFFDSSSDKENTSRFRHFVLKKCNALAQRNTKHRYTNALAQRNTKHRYTNTLAQRNTKQRNTSPFYQPRRSATIEFKKIGRKVFIISLIAKQFKPVAV